MRKMFRVLLLGAIFLLSSNLLAEETICYKNDLVSPSQLENSKLDGGVCDGKLTLSDMRKAGWDILDIKISSSQNKLSYSYYFYKNPNQGLSNAPRPIASSNLPNNTVPINNQIHYTKGDFSIKPIGAKVLDLKDNHSTINVGNLPIGQAGIVVHIYDSDKRLIVASAKVVSSNSTSSVVEFFSYDDLQQEAIPTTNRAVENGDVIVLKYMYNQSLLIAPDYDTYQAVRSDFRQNNFIHPDILAAGFKVHNKLYPKKEDFQKFAIEQNLGTIFFVIDSKIYIYDTKTFALLETYDFPFPTKDKIMPFYSRIEDIKETNLNFKIPFFSENEDGLGYDDYYKRLLGLEVQNNAGTK